MTGKLPQDVDVTTLTPRGAWTWICTLAQQLVSEQGCEFSDAWSTAKALNPELAAKAAQPEVAVSVVEQVGRFGDSAGMIPGPTAPLPYTTRTGAGLKLPAFYPLPNEETLEECGLPKDATFDEFSIAVKAGAHVRPRPTKQVFGALVAHHVSKGMDATNAHEYARQRYPVLAAELPAAS